MLFEKKIQPRCSYCTKGANLNEREVLCLKKGVKSSTDYCHSFRYDPLKRTPPKPAPLDFSKLSNEDFSL